MTCFFGVLQRADDRPIAVSEPEFVEGVLEVFGVDGAGLGEGGLAPGERIEIVPQGVRGPQLPRRERVRVPIAAESRTQDIGDFQHRPGGGRRRAVAVHRSGTWRVRELQQIQR